MKSRYLLLLLIMLCCTGCHVDYYLDIDKKLNLNETISIMADTSSEIESIKGYDWYVPINYRADDASVFKEKFSGVDYYSIHKEKDNSLIRFKYPYDIEKFNDGMFANSCFKHVTVMKKKYKRDRYGALLLSTSNQLVCMDNYDNLDTVDITLYSKYKVLETNADETDLHKYIWHFDRTNYRSKHIYLLLNVNERDLTIWERFLEGDFFNPFTIITFIFILCGVVVLILRKWGLERNKV